MLYMVLAAVQRWILRDRCGYGNRQEMTEEK